MQSSLAPSTEEREPTWLVYARKLPALFKFSLFCEVYDGMFAGLLTDSQSLKLL